jgi:hypothetical protein
VTTHYDVVDHSDRHRGVVRGDAVDDSSQNICARNAERHLDVLFLDLGSCEADHLVQR